MSEEQENQEAELLTPGKMLRQGRINAGLSPEAVANKIHLKVSNIVDLENDVFDPAISATFTKGYLKLYAKQVGIDANEVLAAFDALNTNIKEPAKLQSFSRRVARQASDDRLMMITYGIVVVVVALVVVWWFQQSGSETSAQVERLIDELPVRTEQQAQMPESDDLPTPASTLAGNTNETLVPETNATSVPVTGNAGQQDNGQAQQTTPVPDTTDTGLNETSDQGQESASQSSADDVDMVELVFEFSQDCWMNLVDARGEAVAYGIKAAGRVMSVRGVAPFEVTLGAPEVVQISYNGESVDMSWVTPGRTAKFYLPLTN